MKKSLLALAMASTFALTGCHGIKKVSFEDFKKAADEVVEKAPKVDYISYNGKYGEDSVKFSTNQGVASYSVAEAAVAIALGVFDRVDSMYVYGSSSDNEFYTGMGFKVVTPDVKFEYTGKGYLASVKGKLDGKEYSFSVSHKFVK